MTNAQASWLLDRRQTTQIALVGIIIIILGPGGTTFTRRSARNRAQGYAWRAVVESSVNTGPSGRPLGLGVGGRQIGRARAGGSADVCSLS